MNKRVYYYENDNLKDKVSTARYIFALKFLSNKIVADIGCGARKGPFIIAKTAKEVVGLDISAEAVIYGAKTWPGNNIRHIVSDARNIALKNSLFDAVLSFEVIEHVEKYKDYLKEVFRILKEDAVFIISTPNRLIVSPDGSVSNPDHVREFDLEEFADILKGFFPQVIIYGQFPSQRVMTAEACREKNLRLIGKLPRKLKAIFSDEFKDIILRKYHYLMLRLFKKINEEKIDENDFLISTSDLNQARYFIAICKKQSLG